MTAAAAHVKPTEATNRLILAALRAEPKLDDHNKHIGYCPVHETTASNPSLLIYENASGFLGFSCLSRKCDGKDIVAAIKTRFGLTVPYPTKKVESLSGSVNKIINYPAHEPSLPLKYRKPDDIIYEYHCETGEVAFVTQRWVESNGKKEIRPFFSKTFMSDDGISQKDWDPTEPPKKGRPLYNLHNIHRHSTKPILIVEGEKTADAAMRLAELKDYVVTTWSGGTGAHTYTDWKPLKNRESSIYFWPDNDAAGSKAMREILSKLSTGFKDERFFILDYKKLGHHEVAQGWDLADESACPENPYSIDEMIEGFIPYITEEIMDIGTLEEEIQKLDTDISLLNIAGKIFYVELNRPIDDRVLPYYHWNSLSDLKAERNKQIQVEDRKVSSVLTWANQPSKPAFIGLDFRPDISEKTITTTAGKKINLFTGLPDFGNATSNVLVDLFNEYMEKIVPDEKERIWLIDQMRLSVQRPAVKPGSAIVLIGRQGTGKSTFYRIWKALLGDANSAYLGGGLDSAFNDVMVKSLLIGWDEFEINHHKDIREYNQLKTWITEPRISVNPKGKPAFEVNSYHRFVFTSNSLRPISLPPEDRRFFIYSIGEGLRDNKKFFTDLYTIIDPMHTYAQPMAESDRLAAMNGMMQWLKSTKITTNPLEVMATEIKREMATANALVIEIFRQMYNDQELPQFIADFMDTADVATFGKHPVCLPQMRFGQAMEKHYGRKHADAIEVKLLKKYFMETSTNGIDSKAYNLTFKDDRGNMISKVGKAYMLPPIAEGRAKLEEIMGIKLSWSSPVSQFEEDDTTNVIELAKKDSIKDTIL